LRAVIIAPSNPLLSIEPMLAMPTFRDALRLCHAPVIAVSPIIGGVAVKGPTAKMLQELGQPIDGLEAARRYADVIDGYVLDQRDAHLAPASPVGVQVVATNLLMTNLESKVRLARECLAFADTLAASMGARTSGS
jgi:LPPG:FO 2-phospho-L-lactate transferase